MCLTWHRLRGLLLCDNGTVGFTESCLFPWLGEKQGLAPSLLSIYLASVYRCCCPWTISSCGELALLSRGSAQASHCGGFSCCRARARGLAGFSSCSLRGQCCSSWALGHSPRSSGPPTQLLQGVWDSPTPGSESLSLAPAGEFFTTEPPGKSLALFFIPLL